MPIDSHTFAHAYQQHFHGQRQERLFLSSVSFLITFAMTRAITHAIRKGVGPFRYTHARGVHVHHLVWGILLLLFTGYLWLLQVGTGKGAEARGGWGSRLTSFLYGSGSALTLDEFAMWLNLKNDYWANEGRESIDAVVLFGATLTVGALGGPFFRTLANSWNALKR